jgi:peptidyl-prolyl cis-trans isomerase C
MLMLARPRAALRPLSLAFGLAAATALAAPAALAQDATPPAASPPAAAPSISTVPPETVVATVNGRPITEADLQLATHDYAEDLARVPAGARRGIVLDVLIDMQVMAEAAEKDGITGTEDFKRRIAFMTMQAERNAFVEAKIASSITDAEVKARYDAEIAKFTPPDEIRASHVLVETEDEAKAIIKELEGGGDFAKIAKEKSKDPGSAAQGGDLGYFSKGQMVPPFEEAAFALEVGQFTKTPVKSDFGWHVIRLDDKRKQQPPAFDQVKEQIKSGMLREKFGEVLAGLKKDAKIDVLDQTLKPDATSVPPVPLPGGQGAPAAPAQPEKPAQ